MESGWIPGMTSESDRFDFGRPASPHHTDPESISCHSSAEHNFMHRLLGDLKAQPNAWPLLLPVTEGEVVDYYEVIKRPISQSSSNPPFFQF